MLLKRRYKDGEPHLYLGDEYSLKIIEAKGNLIQIESDELRLFTRFSKDRKVIEKLIYSWYLMEAVRIFEEKLDNCFNLFNQDKSFIKPTLKIKRLKSRWGSLHSKRIVTLNLELIRMPVECIDYVIMHELCHLIHSNHGKEFYNLLAIYYPNFKELKNRLRRIPN